MIFLMTPSLRAPPFPIVAGGGFRRRMREEEEEVRRIVSGVQDKRGSGEETFWCGVNVERGLA